jgi:hypothetical protein
LTVLPLYAGVQLDLQPDVDLLQPDDLHDGQVFVRDGRHLLMDWGDACVAHPFLTLSVTLEGVLARGLDDVEGSVDTSPYVEAYLAPYADRYAGDLVAAAQLALRLGWGAGPPTVTSPGTTTRPGTGCACSWTAGPSGDQGPGGHAPRITPTVSRSGKWGNTAAGLAPNRAATTSDSTER